MDLRPTVIIVSLLATFILVAVVAGLYRFHRTRRRRGMRGSQIEEGDASVRKFIIWKGRVVPDYLKPSGIADRARIWTDRRSWLLRDQNHANTGSRSQRQPPHAPPTWPISKYNSMSQHNPLSEQVEYAKRRHDSGSVREPKGASMRSDSRIQTRGKTPPARAPKVPAGLNNKARRVLGEESLSSSTAQVRKLARSLEKAYDVPSPHTRSKVNISTPTIVITQDFFANHHHRSKEKLVDNASKDRVNRQSVRNATPGGTRRKDPPLPPRSTSASLQPPLEPPGQNAPQRRRIDGLTSANGTPRASSDTLPTKPPITSSTRRPLPDFPQPPTGHSTTPQNPRPYRALTRSRNTVRRKRHAQPNSTHRPAKDAPSTTGPPPTSASSAPNPTTPSKVAAMESPSNHSRTSSKSLATFASSDISDAYTLGRAMPVPIIPTSTPRTVLDRIGGREKPLPRLPVAEDLRPETEIQTEIGKDKRNIRGVDVSEGGARSTTRHVIEG